MSTMSKPNVIAVSCGDLHLSLRPPIARSCEKDWLGVQAGYLKQLKDVSRKHDVPIICAGDIFHAWNAPAELINFSLEHLPSGMLCIPGNHDLPMQNLADVGRSAYGTLVKAKKIVDLGNSTPHMIKGAWLWPFPWSMPLKPLKAKKPKDTKMLDIAVVHSYLWATPFNGYAGAPKHKMLGSISMQRKLIGYDVAVFGDNHISFSYETNDGCRVINNGGFQRRNIDEVDHCPRVNLIYSDGSAKPVFLDTEKDKFLPMDKVQLIEEKTFGVEQFLKSLGNLPNDEVSFTDAIDHYFAKYEVSKGAKELIKEALHET